MTAVNVTTSQNTVSITEGTQTTVVSAPSAVVITAAAAGPVGPEGPPGLSNFNDSGVVNKSVIYYDSNAGEFVANSTWTTQTLVTGGNF